MARAVQLLPMGRNSVVSIGRKCMPPRRASFAFLVRAGYSSVPPPPAAQTELLRNMRDRTGAPMKDVKEVLENLNWNEEAAFQELRKRGLASAARMASRIAAEGLFGVKHFDNDKSAAIVEINSETDFVAKNELFQNLVLRVSEAAALLKQEPDATGLDLAELEDMKIVLEYKRTKSELKVRDAIMDVAARMKENIRLRRAFHYSSPRGVVGSYWHMSPKRGTGRVLGLCRLEVPAEHIQHEAVSRLSGDIAMHVVALKPLFLTRADVKPEVMERELNLSRSQSPGGRAASVFDKMVDSRTTRYYEDVVLMEQKFVANDSKTIQDLVDNTCKELRKTVRVLHFARLQVGEGLEKSDKNIALDVSTAIGNRVATVPNRPSNYSSF